MTLGDSRDYAVEATLNSVTERELPYGQEVLRQLEMSIAEQGELIRILQDRLGAVLNYSNGHPEPEPEKMKQVEASPLVNSLNLLVDTVKNNNRQIRQLREQVEI